ncbi:hypothetical protein H2509_18345 [Stappia sp. F7233]|uniref:DUF1127 domain-containing protein n=1 Tax=Stappia albiluteola TaxID=2758565 RepID=A0A839AJG0_9HYPH|nr:hypothetical protein [Stappia albiluteola]MBA5779094.1 hypothetical protein [Stappia albiluteola]
MGAVVSAISERRRRKRARLALKDMPEYLKRDIGLIDGRLAGERRCRDV